MFVVLPYPPGSNASVRSRRAKARYADRCAETLKKQATPKRGDLYLSVKFFPKNLYHTRGDLDNLLKTLLDSMIGHCFYDDSQVRRIYADMMESSPYNPRVEIVIGPYFKKFSRNNDHE